MSGPYPSERTTEGKEGERMRVLRDGERREDWEVGCRVEHATANPEEYPVTDCLDQRRISTNC